MSSIRSNKLFWQTSTGQSTQTGSITSQSQSEEFLTEYSDNSIVNLQNPILQTNISDYTTASPQTLLNWSTQNSTLDDAREPAVNFWQQPQISLNEMLHQSANNNQHLDAFLSESNTDCQSSLYFVDLFLTTDKIIKRPQRILHHISPVAKSNRCRQR